MRKISMVLMLMLVSITLLGCTKSQYADFRCPYCNSMRVVADGNNYFCEHCNSKIVRLK